PGGGAEARVLSGHLWSDRLVPSRLNGQLEHERVPVRLLGSQGGQAGRELGYRVTGLLERETSHSLAPRPPRCLHEQVLPRSEVIGHESMRRTRLAPDCAVREPAKALFCDDPSCGVEQGLPAWARGGAQLTDRVGDARRLPRRAADG